MTSGTRIPFCEREGRMENKPFPPADPEGFCARFVRCSSSLIEEPESCEVCRFYRDRDSVCTWPEPAQE